MSTRSTILGEMWGEMLWVCWGMGEVMDELKVYIINMFKNKIKFTQIKPVVFGFLFGDR